MCRAGSEQRDIEPATGYCSNEVTHPAGHAGLLIGTHEGAGTHESLSFVCVFFFSDETFLKGGMHLWCMNSTVVTVALPAAGSSRYSLGVSQSWGLSTRWARCLFLCSSLGFSNGPQG